MRITIRFFGIWALATLCLSLTGRAAAGEEETWQQPLLITSAGQSAEVQLAAVLAKRAGLNYALEKTAEPAHLEGFKTLVLSLGASLKGLGAAGLDVPQEKERVRRLLEAAAASDIPVLCLHLGGEARRGQLSDEFISAFLPSARAALVVKSGNQDGLFTRLCREHEIFLMEADRAVNALEPLTTLFR